MMQLCAAVLDGPITVFLEISAYTVIEKSGIRGQELSGLADTLGSGKFFAATGRSKNVKF
jgi:hypothetical protein